MRSLTLIVSLALFAASVADSATGPPPLQHLAKNRRSKETIGNGLGDLDLDSIFPAVVKAAQVSAASELTCAMCEKVLPFVGTDACSDKCGSWWGFTKDVCESVCDALVKCKF